MATVKIDQFGGIMPRQHPTLLSDGMAVTAHNCRLKSGKLVPIREPSIVDGYEHTVYHENGLSKIADANSVYCWKHTKLDGTVRTDFLAFPGRVYFAHGNIADDAYDRIFVTGDTGISWTDVDGITHLNTPCVYLFNRDTDSIERMTLCKDPFDAPKCRFVGTLDENKVVDAYFFISWFDKYGYESPSSNPSKNDNGNGFTDVLPLKYNNNGIISFQPILVPASAIGVRVYKTNAGEKTDNVQIIKEFGSAELSTLASVFTVAISDTTAAETMPEIESAPYDLRDMTFVPGNFYAGRSPSKPHTVLFSDVDNPTNWPLAYQYDIKDNVVKLAVTSNTVFALTDGYPYILSGTAPESMTVTSLAGPAACVSEKGVCVFRNAVYFVSNYGLYTIYNDADAGTVCQCLTEKMFTKEEWQALNPSSAIMGQFDNALHLFFKIPTVIVEGEQKYEYKAMTIDLTESACAITTHDEVATCLCTDDRTDELYFVRNVRSGS